MSIWITAFFGELVEELRSELECFNSLENLGKRFWYLLRQVPIKCSLEYYKKYLNKTKKKSSLDTVKGLKENVQ